MTGAYSWGYAPSGRDVSLDMFEALKLAFARLPRFASPSSVTLRLPARPIRMPGIRSLPMETESLVPKPTAVAVEDHREKAKRIKRQLLDAGVTAYGLLKAESRYLPKVLHDNEKIEAVIYGQHNSSSVMVVATDERIVVLDKKPMAVRFDEVSYEVVSGIGLKIGFFFASVTLHTAITNFDLSFVNLRCADKFVRHIEAERLKHELAEVGKGTEDIATTEVLPKAKTPVGKRYIEIMDNLSGYYLLPIDQEEREQILNEIP